MAENVQEKASKTILTLKYLWDFSFGVLLIGGAPWSVVALLVVVGDYFQKRTQVVDSNAVSLLMFAIISALASLVFVAAIGYRF